MTTIRRPKIGRRWATLLVLLALIGGILPSVQGATRKARTAQDALEIVVLSNRASLISGTRAYVEIVLPEGASASDLEVSRGKRNVTKFFALRDDGRVLGLLRGLKRGKNLVTARLGDETAKVTIKSHPKGGPVLSGPQIQPWICETEANGLGEAKGKRCNAKTVYEYLYKSTDPTQTGLQPYDPESPPDDVAMTTTDQGNEVPFIVRVETGTQNRGIYAIAVLFDPSQPWKPWAAQPGWNHKLHWPFGASCGTEYRQAAPTDVVDEAKLERGWMIANSSLNVLGNNCNTVTSAESVIMLKEHIIENYGEIRYTIGSGCSGGSIGQHVVANAYPGLLQGIQPACSYEDVYSTGNEVVDCHILLHYFNEISPQLWSSDTQRAAVSGHQTQSSCVAWEALFASIPDPTVGCALPEEQMYHPENNPGGARCTTQDMQVGVFGRRPKRLWTAPEKEINRGFAKGPYDNIGVQYGLNALNSGEITAEQFLDLNEKIGGVTIDFVFQEERTLVDPGALKTLYRTGQVNDASQLDEVAIIDLRGTSNSEIHTDFHSYAMRARLDAANGHHDNQIIWTSPVALVGDPVWATESFLLLDEWLAAVESDVSGLPLEQKIVLNKPATAVDACWISGTKVTDMAKCRIAFPYFGAPRIAAGGPPSHDVHKCVLKPISPSDYEVEFTEAQLERLEAAFPEGVCDYSKPPIDKRPSVPWLTYAKGPRGKRIK